MSLREPLKSLSTKSLYFGVFVAMVSTLSMSFLIFRAISVRLERKHFDPVYDRLDQLQLETAVRILNSDGPEALGNYLKGLDHLSGAHHYLLDAHAIDLVDGENRAALLPPPTPFKIFVFAAGVFEIPLASFASAISLARLIRYFGIGYLAVKYGNNALPFLAQHKMEVVIFLAVFVGVSYGLSRWILRERPTASNAQIER